MFFTKVLDAKRQIIKLIFFIEEHQKSHIKLPLKKITF